MICQTCGADLGARASKFCLRCGTPLVAEDPQPDAPAENEAPAQASAPNEDTIPTVLFWPPNAGPAPANAAGAETGAEAESEPASPVTETDNAAAQWVKKYAAELAAWAETTEHKHAPPETPAEFEPAALESPSVRKRSLPSNTRAIAIGAVLLVLIAAGILTEAFRQPADTEPAAPPSATEAVAAAAPETASAPVQAMTPETSDPAAEKPEADLTLETASEPPPETPLDTIPMLPANQLGSHNRPQTPPDAPSDAPLEPPQTDGQTADIPPPTAPPSVAATGRSEDSSLPAVNDKAAPKYAASDNERIESEAAPQPPPPIVQKHTAPVAERSPISMPPPASSHITDPSSSPTKAPVRTATPIPVSRLKSLPMPTPPPEQDRPDSSPPRNVSAENPGARAYSSAPAATTRPPPPSRPPLWLNRMRGELSNCDDFFCRERVRNRYCSARWSHLSECKGAPL
ncbi:MAG: hypothetical protein LBI92_06410 [Azoarcus sp.]|jgi:hypothetical protein|nr:hypothetical protein [Azoarcus sp.]